MMEGERQKSNSALTLSVSIPAVLFDQMQTLAAQLDISLDALVALALEAFIAGQQWTSEAQPEEGTQRSIHQGEVYWARWENVTALESSLPHPQVVIQPDILNQSRISTIVVCALTTNLNRADIPGNVLLDSGEASLPRQSVIEVSKVSTLDKVQLGAYIGRLSEARIAQIFAGMAFVQRSFRQGRS